MSVLCPGFTKGIFFKITPQRGLLVLLFISFQVFRYSGFLFRFSAGNFQKFLDCG